MSNPIRKLQKKLKNKNKEERVKKQVAITRRTLWSDYIFEVKNPDHAEIQEGLTDFLYKYRGRAEKEIESGCAPTIKHNLFESAFDIFERYGSKEPISFVADFCKSSLKKVIVTENHAEWAKSIPSGADITFDIHESWFHITKEGGYHEAHNHPMCSWCAVYYVDIGDSSKENGGVLRFYDPRWPTSQYKDIGTLYRENSQLQTVVPANGKLVIFPSHLYHSITPLNASTKDRISIAMNVRVVGEI